MRSGLGVLPSRSLAILVNPFSLPSSAFIKIFDFSVALQVGDKVDAVSYESLIRAIIIEVQIEISHRTMR
jgi:hypothetical protein